MTFRTTLTDTAEVEMALSGREQKNVHLDLYRFQ